MPNTNDRKLLRLIRYAPVVLVVLFTLTVNFVLIQENRLEADASIKSLRTEVIDRQKATTRQHVELVINEIRYQKALAEKVLKEQAEKRVNEAYAIAHNIYNTNRDKSKEEITRLISEALRPIRFFEGRGYFFIFEMDGTNVMHGLRPQLEGTRAAWGAQDVRGTYILQEHIALVEEHGQAFYRWWYPKPGAPKTEEFDKIGFGKRFEPYNWLIGTGEYVVDVENDIQKQVLDWVNGYGYGDNGYVFAIDQDGKIIAHREHDYIGQYISDVSISSGLHMRGLTTQVESGGGFLSYSLRDTFSSKEARKKMTYVQGLEDWNWIIGTGFYLSDYENYLAEKQAELEAHNRLGLIKVSVLGGVMTIVLTVLSLVIGSLTAKRFNRFQDKISHDFSELESTKDQMQHMAQHDALTGLPNRLLLIENINQGIALANRGRTQLAVMFVDLDDFKKVNDLYGHSSGDKLLEAISRKFETILGPDDSVSRFGGDEFIFCFPSLKTLEEAKQKVHQIKAVFDEQFIIDGKVLATDCSIGVSMYPEDSDDAESLIRKADIVLYKSKAINKGQVLFYDDNINEQVKYDFVLEEELRRALVKNEITVLYQPQIDVNTEKMVSVEALARWHNDRLGSVSPLKFIAIAEDTGMIHQIGRYVFKKACADILTISPNGPNALKVSINISPKQLMEQGFTEQILEVASSIGIDIKRINLEITENVLINDLAKVAPIINKLKSLGFGVSLDDFGTGYSSLSYLNTLPITEIKIDRCFIEKLMESEQSNTLVKAIIAIGDSCDMTVVAEGVETRDQFVRLISYGCHLVQGYYFDRPLPIEKLAVLDGKQVSA